MSKKGKKNIYSKFTIKDVLVIIISVAAFAGIILLILWSQETDKEQQNALDQISDNIEQGDSEYKTDEISGILAINEINQSGWVEFYNQGSKTVDLSGYTIVINQGSPLTLEPDSIVAVGRYLVVETGNTLGGDGRDVITLYDKEDNVIIQRLIPVLEKDESYASVEDGGISYRYMTSSREASNLQGEIINKDKLQFSVPGGFYSTGFELELSVPEGWIIYYTTDGTTPTTEDGETYTGPILIENKSGSNMQYAVSDGIVYPGSYKPAGFSIGTVIQVIAVDAGGNVMDKGTQSYFIDLNNAADFLNMPVISITTAPENFFDYFDGIYVTGRTHEDATAKGENAAQSFNYLNGWTRQVHIEFFESGKAKTYEGDMDVSIIRDISVSLAQKSFLLSGTGVGDWKGSSLTDYYSESNRTITLQTYKRDNNYKIREYIASALLKDRDVGTADFTPCIVFINGEYWGGYMLRAEYDNKYIEKNYEIAEGKAVIARNGTVNNPEYQAVYNEFYNFITTMDLTVDENYQWVGEHMDVQSYLDYFCANMYLANGDYGNDSMVMWRSIDDTKDGYEDGKWRWLMPKLDYIMSNNYGNLSTGSIDSYLLPGVAQDPFFRALIVNDTFSGKLLDTMKELCEATFSEENTNKVMEEASSFMRKMAISSYKRFVGSPSDTFYTSEVDRIKTFFEYRKEYILLYTEEAAESRGADSLAENINEDNGIETDNMVEELQEEAGAEE